MSEFPDLIVMKSSTFSGENAAQMTFSAMGCLAASFMIRYLPIGSSVLSLNPIASVVHGATQCLFQKWAFQLFGNNEDMDKRFQAAFMFIPPALASAATTGVFIAYFGTGASLAWPAIITIPLISLCMTVASEKVLPAIEEWLESEATQEMIDTTKEKTKNFGRSIFEGIKGIPKSSSYYASSFCQTIYSKFPSSLRLSFGFAAG